METIERRFTDKTKWGRGPWNDEPDKVQWQDKETGLPCLAVRGPGGNWCGYVGVAEGHPYHGVEYSGCSLQAKCGESYCEHGPGNHLEVHGGITYSDFCAEEKENGICHLPAPGEPEKVWWFGFDCAHAGDLSPSYQPDYKFGSVYRALGYVKRQVAFLAKQLKNIGDPK